MRTITQAMHPLTDASAILQDMTETLTKLDPSFPAEEAAFRNAVEELEQPLAGRVCPTVREYLQARETAFAAAITYIRWQGFHLNWEIHRHPVNALLLGRDYEELCCERRLGSLPRAAKAQLIMDAFHEALRAIPDADKKALAAVTNYYAYLETWGYKLAHYWGFRLADEFLVQVVPGYAPDFANTRRYRMELAAFLQIDPGQLEGTICPPAALPC